MLSGSSKNHTTSRNSLREILLILLVFLLLALLIWRWFDYRIARITQPTPSKGYGLVIDKNEYPTI
jgi:hypothetical protein